MEDRFKVRVWDTRNNCWLHGYDTCGGCSLLGETILLGGWLEGVPLEDYDKLVFEQCTGRKDPNDTLIYEGDMMRVHTNIIGVVKWLRDGFSIKALSADSTYSLSHNYRDSEYPTIIGNIHMNPTLLEDA